jgi:nucleotide-binding universal stress UspA family protein
MKTILVGYDRTDPSERALERAAELAAAYDARVIVTNVVPPAKPDGRPRDPAPPPSEDTEQLANVVRHLAEHGVHARYVAAEGAPATTITSVAEEHDADLIVVGTRDAGLFERLHRPSVSRSVSHRTDRDVLIVHPDDRGPTDAVQ